MYADLRGGPTAEGVHSNAPERPLMLELIVLRHGHSPMTPGDHARQLSEAGRAAARRVGEALAASQLLPDLIISSTAVRTQQSTEAVLQTLGNQPPLERTRALYAPGSTLQPEETLYPRAAHERRILVVGHNPTLEDFVTRLSGQRVHMHPASWAHLCIACDDWTEISASTCTLKHFSR